MRHKKSWFFLIFSILAISITLFGSLRASFSATELVPLYTPPVGGTAYILGAGIVSLINKYIPGANFVHQATTGTLDIVRRMMERESAKKACFGIFGTPDAWNAYKGVGVFSGKPFPNLRAVVFVNASDMYLVVPAKSRIKSWADVKGKRIGIGGPGSTVANTTLLVLEYHGITKSDFKPYYYTYRETVEGIQNGSLDGGMLGGGYPVAMYRELSLQQDVRIVPVDEKVLKRLTSEHPYLYGTVVKAKAYKGIEQDTPIYGFTTALFTHAGVSEDLVYRVLKNLFEHKEEYYAVHQSARDMKAEDAAKGIPVPFHPGAERYLREIGVMKR